MSHKRLDVDSEIERRIRERDRLLARAQRGARGHGDLLTPTHVSVQEQRALTDRVALLEGALANYLNEEWLRSSSMSTLVEHARRALAAARSCKHDQSH